MRLIDDDEPETFEGRSRFAAAAALVPSVVVAFAFSVAIVWPWVGATPVWFTDFTTGPQATSLPGLPTGPLVAALVAAARAVFSASVASWLVPAVLIAAAGVSAGAAAVWLGVGRYAATAATALSVTAPFLFDRVFTGQIGVIGGYGATPLLVAAAVRVVESNSSRRWAQYCTLWAAAALCSIHWAAFGALLAAGAAVCASGWGRRVALRAAGSAVAAVALIGIWVAFAAPDHVDAGDPLADFATAAVDGLGLLGSIAATGGFWRQIDAHPLAANPTLTLAATATLWLITGVGWVTRRRRTVWFVAGIAAAAGFAAAGAAGPTGALYRFLFDAVPGAGVLREPQKFAAFLVAVVALGAAQTVGSARLPERVRAVAVAAAAVVALAGLVGMGAGLNGRISPSDPTAALDSVAAALDSVEGVVFTVPFQSYWNPGNTNNRSVAEPTVAMLGPRVMVGCSTGLTSAPGSPTRCSDDLDTVARAVTNGDGTAALQMRAAGVGAVISSGPNGSSPNTLRAAGLVRLAGDRTLSIWAPAPN